MKVHVTTDHIRAGVRKHHFRNPLALAIGQAFNDEFCVVTDRSIHLMKPVPTVTGLPITAINWLREWNLGCYPSPTTFIL